MSYVPGDLLWTRLEPIAKNPSMDEGLRAAVQDPMWMLTRQWQLGEFAGEDGGSAVDVEVSVAHDHLGRVRLSGRDDDVAATDYTGGPLEAIVEREAVLTERERPDARLAAQAGAQFRRLLASHDPAGDAHYLPGDLPAGYVLEAVSEDPDEPVDPTDLRFEDAVGGDELDGHRLFQALHAAIDQGTWSSSATFPWEGRQGRSGPSDLPTPDGVDATAGWFQDAARDFRDWYDDLYDEPESSAESAWDPERMEYRVGVATGGPGGAVNPDADGDPGGDTDTETVLGSGGYRGGRLDWYSFGVANPEEANGDDSNANGESAAADPSHAAANQPDAARSLVGARANQPESLYPEDASDDPERTETDTKHVLPTGASFPGMPDARYWAFEDADVDLEEISVDDVSDQVLVNFAMVYGNDWYTFPVRTPLGSLSRVTSLTVTDTFGEETEALPTTEISEWNMYSLPDLPNFDEPGLFLPPVLDDAVESDPVEDVSLVRDEMANLAFAVESTVESPAGTPVERDEYRRPQLVLEEIAPNPDVDEEYVALHNPGTRELDVGGWIVTDATETFTFPVDATVPADATVTLYTGTEPAPEDVPPDSYYWGAPAGPPDDPDPIWFGSGATVLSVYDADATVSDVTASTRSNRPLDHLRLRERVPGGEGSDLPTASYRLATDLPDHWFAMQPDRSGSQNPLDPAVENTLKLSLVLDAETLDAEDYDAIPDPEGEILTPYRDAGLFIYDEELLGTGKRIRRTYQAANWTDGSTHVWSGRSVTPGAADVGSSTLRYDVLAGWTEDEES